MLRLLCLLRMQFMLLSVVAMLVAGAFASASASATTPSVNICVESATAGGGQWNNNECSSAGGSKEFETKEAPVGTDISATGGVATLDGELGSVKVIITCVKSKTTGEIKSLTDTEGEVTFEECEIEAFNNETKTFQKLTTCEVPNIKFRFLSTLLEEGGVTKELFKGTLSEEKFVEIAIKNKSGESCIEKGTFPVKGTQIALIPNAGVLKLCHLLDFSKADSKLTFDGAKAEFETTVELLLLLTTRTTSRYAYFHFV
jgi:hypothetical protein